MRFTIKIKLGLAFGLIVLMLFGVTGYGLASLASINDTIDVILNGPVVRMQTAMELKGKLQDIVRTEKNIILETDTQKVRDYDEVLTNSGREFEILLTKGEQIASAQGKLEYQGIRDKWESFKRMDSQLRQLALANRNDEALKLNLGAMRPVYNAMSRSTDELVAMTEKQMSEQNTAAQQVYEAARNILLIVAAITLLLAIGSAAWIMLGISKGLRQIGELAEALAIGDLDRRIDYKSDDEIKDVMNSVEALSNEIKGIANVAHKIAIGDLTEDPKVQSDKDVLGKALLAVITAERKVAAGMEKISIGDLSYDPKMRSDQDILAKSLAAVVDLERRIATVMEQISLGDLSHEPKPRSDADKTVHAMKAMVLTLRGIAELSGKIANGDLTVQPKAMSEKDEIGKALVMMVERLRSVVGDALSASDNVSSGSQELSAASEQVSQGASEQAAAAEEVSASMEEMSSNIKQNAENASQTEKMSRQSAKEAEASGEAVNKAVSAMQTIAEKITIVQEIARQTDLLALNAAVEAARAGEHGKGFAVVASEVRKLAERSQVAATEINSVSSETMNAAKAAGETLAKLVPDIRKTAELVAEISAACREQDIGASQINEAIQQLDQVTQQNAAASEQMSATSEELAVQSEELQTSISYFRTDATGGPSPATAPVVRQAPRKPAPHFVRQVAHITKKPAIASKAPAPVNNKGYSLDLSHGGPDAGDAEFKEYQ